MNNRPAKLFLSYSHQDTSYVEELLKHLSLLKKQRVIEHWYDRRITAGDEWGRQIDFNLEQADIIIVIVSADFLASEYCHNIELDRSLARHMEGSARVIPIIVRPTDWHGSPLGRLQALPKDGKPVTKWDNRDEAWVDVTRGIHLAVEEQQRRRNLAGENARLLTELEDKQIKLQQFTDRCNSMERELIDFRQRDRQIDAEIRQQVHEASVRLLEDLRTAHQAIAELTTRLGVADRELRDREETIDRLTKQRDEQRQEINKLRDDAKRLQSEIDSIKFKRLVSADLFSAGVQLQAWEARSICWHFAIKNRGDEPIRLVRVDTNWKISPEEKNSSPGALLFDESHTNIFADNTILQPGEISGSYEIKLDINDNIIQKIIKQFPSYQMGASPSWSKILRPLVRVIYEGTRIKFRDSTERLLERENSLLNPQMR